MRPDALGTHPIDACLDEADGFLGDAERELDFGDDAAWNLVQATKWLHAGLEALLEVREHFELRPVRAVSAWLVERLPATHKPLVLLLRAYEERKRRSAVQRVVREDDIPYGKRHFWDVWAEPQCCIYCTTERSLESERTVCRSKRIRMPFQQDTTLS